MPQRTLGILSLITAAVTVLWLVFTIAGVATSPPTPTLGDKIFAIQSGMLLHVLTYINAALITLAAVLTFCALYFFCREQGPFWALVGLVFVPIYGLANLVAYLAQIFVVPGLIAMASDPASRSTAYTLLSMTLHTWPGSAVLFLNQLAYAVLGIPSIIYGLQMGQVEGGLKLSGWLLAASGVLSMLAFIGLGFNSPVLMNLTLVSGVVFLAALILMSVRLRRRI